jgi:hypothetical protein
MSVNTRTEFLNITKSSDLTIYRHVDAVFDQIWGGFFICTTRYVFSFYLRGRRGHERIGVGFTTNCAISAYHH